MFARWIDMVFAGCTNDWHYMLCLLLLLFMFDIIATLISVFGRGAR